MKPQYERQAGIYSWNDLPLPIQITLSQDAELYEAPDRNANKAGTVSAQKVHVSGIFIPDENVAAKDESILWVQIRAWMGERWIQVEAQDFYGNEFSMGQSIALLREEPIYSSPSSDALTGEKLKPQTVELREVRGLYYQVMTDDGLKWIKAPGNMAVYNISEYGTELELPTDTPIFGWPELDGQPAGWLAPQKMQAFEYSTVSGWYHIQTWLGPMWVHPLLSMPAGIVSVNESITIQDEILYLLPNGASKQLAHIRGKTIVQVLERAGQWFHVVYGDQTGWVFLSTAASAYTAPKTAQAKQLEPIVQEETLSAAGGGWYGQPLAVHMDANGQTNYTRLGKGIDYGTEMNLEITFGNLSDHDIELVEPVQMMIVVERIEPINNGADRKETPVWKGIMPIEAQVFRSGAAENKNYTKIYRAIWDQRDADGVFVPPGEYAVSFEPFSFQYKDESGELKVQQVDNHLRSKMWFTLTAP